MREIGRKTVGRVKDLIPQKPLPLDLSDQDRKQLQAFAASDRDILSKNVLKRMWARRAVYSSIVTLGAFPVTGALIAGSITSGSEIVSQMTSNPNLPLWGIAASLVGVACINVVALAMTVKGALDWKKSNGEISNHGKALRDLEAQLGEPSRLGERYGALQNANKLTILRYGLIGAGMIGGAISGLAAGPLAVITSTAGGALGGFGGNLVFHGLERIAHYGADHRLITAARKERREINKAQKNASH